MNPILAAVPRWSDLMHDFLLPWAGRVISALLVLLIGFWIARLLGRLTSRALGRVRGDLTLARFLESAVKLSLYVVVIIAVLGQLGVQTTSLLAMLGAAGLAIGLALQKSLSDFAAGVLLLILRPFKAGDQVEVAGITGTVERIHLFQSILHSADSKELTVPNSKIFAEVITNFSVLGQRRIDLVIGIAYEANIREAKRVIEQVLAAEARILPEPKASFGVMDLADSSVNLYVRPWVRVEDYWSVRCDLLEAIKLAFDAADINIPFPQMELHLRREAAAPHA